jgi:energy-coupling factor transport system ATP-binding protein
MDEPTSELDEESEKEVLRHLRLLAREGRTVLLAIHGLEHVKGLADRICFVDRGRARILRPEDAR